MRRMRRLRDVYLVEYGCFRPKPCYRTPFATCLEHAHLMPYLVDEESVAFAMRLLERSGLGEETCVPDAYHYMPPDRSLKASRDEAELVIFAAVDDVFAKTAAMIGPAEANSSSRRRRKLTPSRRTTMMSPSRRSSPRSSLAGPGPDWLFAFPATARIN